MNPSVSVIIPTYNRKEMLAECIAAILGQTYAPREVMVLDDGSTDGTAEFISGKFGSRVMVHSLDHSGLPAVARNRGIELSTGDIIAFCDSDDIWLREKLERQIHWMESRSAEVCCSDALVHGTGKERYLSRHRFHSSSLGQCLAWENYVITSSVLIRKASLGGMRFSERPVYRGYEDYLLWLGLSAKCAFAYIEEPLLWYRIHENSLSRGNRVRDSIVQLRIVFSGGIIVRHPLLGVKKILRYLVLLAAGPIWRKQ